MAVPRDVDPGVGDVFGVTLLDIDALRAQGERSLQQRRTELARVREIITAELDRYRFERSAREAAPIVTALRSRAEELRAAELARHSSKLNALDPGARTVLESITRGLVNKLLHDPTVRLKDAAGSARGELYADALSELFALDLPDEPPTAD